MVCIGLSARPARADAVFESAAYVALRRPMKSHFGRNVLLDTPHLRQNLLGLAFEVAREPAPGRGGLVARLGLALEERTDCGWSQRCPFTRSSDEPYLRVDGTLLAPTHPELGGHARVGYWLKNLQVEAGVIAYSFTPSGGTPRPSNRVIHTAHVIVVPDVLVRASASGAHVAAGFGSFAPTTLLGPSYYLQAGYSDPDRMSGAFTLGYSTVNGDEYFAYRADLDITLRITSSLRLGHGFGFVWAGKAYNRQVGGDFRVHATVRF